MKKVTVGIIGGGAAGMIAAIHAAKAGARVTILEKNDRLGKKILMTGNGKCNLSNQILSTKSYYTDSPEKIDAILKQFSVSDTLNFFSESGLMTKQKGTGIYPYSEQASTVLDILRFAIEKEEIVVMTQEEVDSITPGKDFLVRTKTNKTFHYDKILLTCGSKAAPSTGSDGSGYLLAKALSHHIVEVVPALTSLKCRGDFFKSVAGVRTQAIIKLYLDHVLIQEEEGELQLTEYGVSGIPIFQLSRNVTRAISKQKKPVLVLDLFPQYTEEELKIWTDRRFLTKSEETAEAFYTGYTNKKLMLLFLRLSGIAPTKLVNAYSPEQIHRVPAAMKSWKIEPISAHSYQNAQACAGGIPLTEIKESMESKLVKNLYFAGEILDADGRCGGYNLQWAWSTGAIAGRNMAGKEPTYD